MEPNCVVWSAIGQGRFINANFHMRENLIYWSGPNGWEVLKESTIRRMQLSFYPGV